MSTYTVSYPSLQRRLIAERRARALFFGKTTQRMDRTSVRREVARAALSLVGIAAWATLVVLLGG
jgi:hypothetical protein